MRDPWPALPLAEWQDTYRTLHMWTQIAGKIRKELSPPLNHFWHVALYVNARGLTTGPIPYPLGISKSSSIFCGMNWRSRRAMTSGAFGRCGLNRSRRSIAA